MKAIIRGLRDLGMALLLRWGGTLLIRAGQGALATQMFRAADDLSPNVAPPFAYPLFLWKERQFEQAKLALTKILARTPKHPEANNLLGVLFFEEGNTALAAEHFKQAIAARSDFAAPCNNLGNIHRANRELGEAENCYRTALERDPNYVEAITNLGALLLSHKGDNLAAERFCLQAIDLAPGYAGAYCNLGNALLRLDRSGEAVAAYRRAVQIQPGLPEASVNLAVVLEDNSFLAGTIDYYEEQLKRQPANPLSHVWIARALHALNHWDDGRQRLLRALELDPECTDALCFLAMNDVRMGDVSAAIDCYRRMRVIGPSEAEQLGIAFNSLYLEEASGKVVCSEYREWAERYANRPLLSPPSKDKNTERRLRVGYMSRDFVRHSVAYFLEPILTNHDHKNFEVFCYSVLLKGDSFTERFKSLADNWRDISTMPEAKVAQLVREDEIDILVDLSGHTLGHRLGVFARKPAPVQVTYLGHPTTTGLNKIDYRFGDAVADPVDLTKDHYVERLWQLPGCFLTYQPPSDAPPIVDVPSTSRGYITFGSFNNVAKINSAVIEVWAKILLAIPRAHLLLKSSAFSSHHGRTRLAESFSLHGIAPDRLELVDWCADKQDHLRLYGEVDIALDTFPYNGTATTCEAFWMGVPVICLEGSRHSARVGASLMKVLDLEELLAPDTAGYITRAVKLAGDPSRIRALREGMRDRMRNSALLDHAGFTRGLEHSFRQMWREYCQQDTQFESAIVGHNQFVAGSAEMFRLHIGGRERNPGWKVLNIAPGPAVDFIGDIRALTQFADKSCGEIYASHVLEHVSQGQVLGVLRDLLRILKPGGSLRLSVPDLDALCRLYVEHSDEPQVREHIMRMMFGGQTDPHDYHQVGFDFEFLRRHLRGVGFERISRVAAFDIFSDASGLVHYGTPISINVIAFRPDAY